MRILKGVSHLATAELSNTKAFFRCRQLQEKRISNSSVEFEQTQRIFFQEMEAFEAVAVKSLIESSTLSSTFGVFMKKSTVTAKYSRYPYLEQPLVGTTTMFRFMLDYANAGMAVARISFDDFEPSYTSRNNEIRFILDNWYGSKALCLML